MFLKEDDQTASTGDTGSTGTEEAQNQQAPDSSNPSQDDGSKEQWIPKSRLDQVLKENKELKSWKQQQEEERAKKEGDYQKLADQAKKEAETYKQRYQDTLLDNQLTNAIAKLQPSGDPSYIKRMIRDDVEVDDDGNVTNVEQAVGNLKQNFPQLFSRQNVGHSGANPQNGGGEGTKIPYSKTKDPDFLRENFEAVEKAEKEGRIDFTS